MGPQPPSSHHHYHAPQDLLLISKCVLAPTHHMVFTCTHLSADTHPILLRIAYRADPKTNIWVTAILLLNLVNLLAYSMPLPRSKMSCEVGEGSCLLPEPQLPRNT